MGRRRCFRVREMQRRAAITHFPVFALFACIFFGPSSTAVHAQQTSQPAQQQPQQQSYTDLEKRVRELEAIVQRQEAERSNGAAPANGTVQAERQEQPPATTPPTNQQDAGQSMEFQSQGSGGRRSGVLAGWDEGFYMQSADNNFHLRITGQIQADYRAFVDPVDYTDIDRFFLRRARLGIEADMFRYYEFRFLPDFGQGQSRIQDAYLNVHYWDAFQVEAGKFKQPVSYEQLIQDRYVPTLERSLIDQLVPARDEGLMLHGRNLFENRLD